MCNWFWPAKQTAYKSQKTDFVSVFINSSKNLNFMKSKIIIVLALVIMVSACKKETETPVTDKTQLPSLSHMAKGVTVTKADRWYIEKVLDCWPPAINCLPDFVLTGKRVALMHFIDTNPTSSDVRTYFLTETGSAIADSLGITGEDLSDLQSGNYSVIYENSGSADNKTYFFFGPASTLSVSNAEYIIPIADAE